MAYPCTVCTRRFDTRGSLKNHTGTQDPTARKAHQCNKCDQVFCSRKALQQHQNAPSHATMFRCDVCNLKFGSKQAIQQHTSSTSHARTHAKHTSPIEPGINTMLNTSIISVTQDDAHTTPPAPRTFKSSKGRMHGNGATYDQSPDKKRDKEEDWGDISQAAWDSDQDWALCDKDCGWCGHCADGVYL